MPSSNPMTRFLLLASLMLFTVPAMSGPVADGKEWFQPADIMGFSWNNFNAVCAGGPCSGFVGTTDLTGWTWASIAEVNALFNSYIGSNQLSGPSVHQENDSPWAPAILSDFTPSDTPSGEERLLGLVRDEFDTSNGRYALIEDRLVTGSYDTAQTTFGFSKANTNFRLGAFLHRPGSVVLNYKGTCNESCGSVGLMVGDEVTGTIALDPTAAVPGNVLVDSDIVDFNFTFGHREFGPPAYTIRLNDEVRVNATGNGLTGDATGIIKFLEGGSVLLGQILADDLRWIAASVPTGSNSAKGTGTFNPTETGTTPVGDYVEVTPTVVDELGEPVNEVTSIAVEYELIINAGETTVEVVAPAPGDPLPPEGFKLGESGVYLDFNTTATFSGPIQVCLGYNEADYADEASLKLYHYDDAAEEWTDITIYPDYPDTALDLICGLSPSFSIIVPVEPAPPALSCSGFGSPLAKGPVKVKKNRVLPFKAQLMDADNQHIDNLGLVAPPVVQVIFKFGELNATDVSIAALPNGAGTDGNQFEFIDSYWRYNLKTKNYTAPGTYTVTMESGDLGEYTIDPVCEGSFVIK